MRVEARKLRKFARCDRCKRRPSAAEWERGNWNLTLRDGVVVGFLCPGCQTPEENAEAEVNLATLDYRHSHLDEQGRWTVPPKA